MSPGSFECGDSFEHFLILEVKRLADYSKPDWRLSYLRTKDNAEIDLIIERPGLKRVAIEIKSTDRVDGLRDSKTRGFHALLGDMKKAEGYILSRDPIERKEDGVWILPWQKGLKEIGLVV